MIALPDIGSATAVLLIMGAILAISIGADTLCRRLGLPRISALVLLGVAIALVRDWGGLGGLTPGVTLLGPLEEPLVTVALVMVAFLLGGDLQVSRLRKTGGRVLILSLAVAIGSTLIVGAGMLMVGASVTVALALGAMAAATDPAAVREVVRDGAAKSTLGRLLLDVVAIDDAWGIILFGLALALAGWLVTADGVVALAHAGWELGGALMLGAAIGGPAAYMTGRLRSGQPTQTEAIAVVLLVAGLSTWLEVSPLLAAMTTGAVIANLAPHHTQSFREIEQVDWPFLVFFFVLAGAKLDMARALDVAGLTAAFIAFRLLGRVLGGWAGARLGRARPADVTPAVGLALTPQAGVALGMALLAGERFPDAAAILITVAITSTVIFEIGGPILTSRLLRRAT